MPDLKQRIMGYIDSGKQDGATVVTGGDRHGKEGYFINPTIFTDVKPDMKIVQEEIFGPVGVVIKFENAEGALRLSSLYLCLFLIAAYRCDPTGKRHW
jgi:acyl-CoA reductase-like NAD-dependent aldehyde dehydrogenase